MKDRCSPQGLRSTQCTSTGFHVPYDPDDPVDLPLAKALVHVGPFLAPKALKTVKITICTTLLVVTITVNGNFGLIRFS